MALMVGIIGLAACLSDAGSPAAWAIVTDVGGVLSHSSIVAREYDIPAVLATGVATTRIRDGQMLRVDGSTGTVEILDD